MTESLLTYLETGSSPAIPWIKANLDYPEKEWCLIWPFSRNHNGYAEIGRDSVAVHRLMCEHRNGPPPTPEHQAAHSCGRGHHGCVNPLHLNWRTVAENQIERYEHQGVPGRRRKLTVEQVAEIRALEQFESPRETATRFNISYRHIRDIQTGKYRKSDKVERAFSDDEVRRIRETPWQQKTANQWASEFGVTRSVIDRIRGGKTYRRLLPEFSGQPMESPPHETHRNH